MVHERLKLDQRECDKLIALQGTTRAVENITGEPPIAGMWKQKP
jgi:hypothetical protein